MGLISSDISSYLRDKAALVEQKLETLIPEQDVPHKQLFLAARYALLGAGKRLRPLLALTTAETLGSFDNSALTTACALEMIHTYSLIHDDLPCMDDDDFRRGKPSLHKAFGEALAVLAGDYLLTYAFEVIADDHRINSSQKIALVKLLAHHSGGHGMLGGQIMDIQAEGLSIDLEMLKKIHRYKTGALITASILSGGIVANAGEAEIESLRLFGDDLGLAFQIIDDVIDVIASEQKHGKTVASDTANNKTTYVTLMGVDTAQQTAYDLYTRSLTYLDRIKRDTTLLKELAKKLVYRSH